MYTSTILPTFITLLALTSASPLVKRTTCAIVGREYNEQIAAYGIAAAATSSKGSLTIYCTNGVKWDNDDKLPKKSQTIKAEDSKLERDVHWKQDWQTGGYKGCEASYGGGKFEKGVVGESKIESGVAISGSGNSCKVEFTI